MVDLIIPKYSKRRRFHTGKKNRFKLSALLEAKLRSAATCFAGLGIDLAIFWSEKIMKIILLDFSQGLDSGWLGDPRSGLRDPESLALEQVTLKKQLETFSVVDGCAIAGPGSEVCSGPIFR